MGRNYYRDRREEWDREHFERSMDMVRSNQRDPHQDNATVAGTPYEGGVFSTGTYGSGAEFYSVTGTYENPLMHNPRATHRGKGPKSYRRSDERIQEEICEQLALNPLIDASLMEVRVHNGEVTLSGEVFDRRMKYMADDVVDEVFGVTEINNRLRVARNRAA
jgi:osmotically-inducible protein OsmY